MLNQRLILIVLFLPIILLASVDYNEGSLISMEGGNPPTIPTLIRIFDNAIINAYNTSYECTVSIVSTDPDDDDIKYEILWDIDPLFTEDEDPPTTIPIGFHNSGDIAITTIPAEEETIYYWKARAKDYGNPWTEWSEVRSFTMDMEAGDVYWYQVTGAQFEQGIRENVLIEEDLVKLESGQNSGSLISPPVVFAELYGENSDRDDWDGVKWTKSSGYDDIKMQIEYYDGNSWILVPDLPGNSEGLSCSGTTCEKSIQSIDEETYNTLRLKVLFTRSTSKSADEPTLLMWSMGNIGDNITIIEENEKPLFFALNKVKPNPSVGNIEINYQLPERTNIKLIVIDLLGRNIRTLVNGVKESGYYSIQWRRLDKNNNRLPPGIYFIWMEAGAFKETQKVILIR